MIGESQWFVAGIIPFSEIKKGQIEADEQNSKED
jgi:hypothetical protein